MSADPRFHGKRFFIVTLGCFRNEVESDMFRTALSDLGLVETTDPASSDIALVNTCGFIRAACDEAIDTILELDEALSAADTRPPLMVVGCMAQRYPGLTDAMPEVQGLLGAGWSAELPAAVTALLDGGTYAGGMRKGKPQAGERRSDSSIGTTLFVRAADGCARHCAFCTIPSIRGPYRSRLVEEIAYEVEALCGGSDREVVLLAQDLSYYGTDLGGPMLAPLLERLSGIERARWIRMLYLQPEGVTPTLIEAVSAGEKVCHYFDVPFQHASSEVLKRMGRPGDRETHLALISRIREAIPDASIRTTLMVGYPGETDEDFEVLERFVKEARFDWVGAFCYSPEDGTRAALLDGQVPSELAAERYNRVLDIQQEIEESRSRAMIGRTLEVVIDAAGDPGEPGSKARSYREAPVVDGLIYLEGCEVSRGFARCRITGAEGLDLVAEVTD